MNPEDRMPPADRPPAVEDHPHVVVFPPLMFASTLVLGLLLQWWVPFARLPALPARIVGAVLLLAGVLLARWSRMTLTKGGTNVNPREPTLALVTSGPFRYSRNPLYMAALLMYLGVSLLFVATWPLALLVPMVFVLQWGVIGREETYLSGKFGGVYADYRSRVRRWF